MRLHFLQRVHLVETTAANDANDANDTNDANIEIP